MLPQRTSSVLESLLQDTQKRYGRPGAASPGTAAVSRQTQDREAAKPQGMIPCLGSCDTTRGPRQCPLCLIPLDSSSLVFHIQQCPNNVRSCEFCAEAIPTFCYDEHASNCPENRKECYVCRARVVASLLSQHLRECAPGKELIMFHGTTLEACKHIMREGFKPSMKGVLGEGVYLSRNVKKAVNYGPVIVECVVRVGSVVVIDKRNHHLRKNWPAHGYQSAWIPPDAGVTASGLEEHCVHDTRRVVPVRFFSEAQGQIAA
ncbi:hypothetical protein DQ04_03741090 [Trypanosoma grayi]|uniref:hypothetical protein n=1 Tax=Trypanosoma grayi TaxID=71804 RepID=UPI0004F3F4FE|nr:hypothetical protein DQ04_03741090 [Trypanosoma grayi]KEG10416.1 hypothetical protein DQ04_03741090 [Trypanosoma grayi]